jgi:dihydrofolate reductase
MRKIIAYLATSVDGFIARPDGDVAWLDRPQPPDEYGMPRFYRSVDTVIMGRKTYETTLRLGHDAYPDKANIVLSRRRWRSRSPHVEYSRERVGALASRLRRAAGKDIWLAGGAEVFGAFLDAGQLDELIVHVVPVAIGKGIPLFSPRRRKVNLELRSIRRFPDGVVRLHYRVPRSKR